MNRIYLNFYESILLFMIKVKHIIFVEYRLKSPYVKRRKTILSHVTNRRILICNSRQNRTPLGKKES
jgi:hypothetical protein